MSFAAHATADSMASMAVTLANERLILRADCSLFWPKRSTLFVADIHFGKASVFQQRGMALPAGTIGTDLERLTAALVDTGARRLVVLGDLVHAPPEPDAPWLAELALWRNQHPDLVIDVVRGNHDRMLNPPRELGVDTFEACLIDPPFVLCHEPAPSERGVCLAGHLHPVVRLRDGSESLRLPVFWQSSAGFVLPAFSSLAGGALIAPGPVDRLYAVAPDCVVEVSAKCGQRRRQKAPYRIDR